MITRHLWFSLVLFGSTVHAQTTMIVDVRTGFRPANTYNFVEAFLVHGRVIGPDFGYIDFAESGQYREWFAGGGYKPFVSKHLTVANELYIVLASGPASGGAKYLQLWTGLFYSLAPRLGGEAAFFPYIPLNASATKQWVVERAKLEYTFHPVFKAGAGYGAYQFGGDRWQHRPFVTATVTPFAGKFGSMEFWLQKFKDGAQIQLRYELVYVSKKKNIAGKQLTPR